MANVQQTAAQEEAKKILQQAQIMGESYPTSNVQRPTHLKFVSVISLVGFNEDRPEPDLNTPLQRFTSSGIKCATAICRSM